MIFTVPDVGTAESDAIAQIDELRQRLRWQVAAPSRWIGGLRRLTFARAVQASNSIEGYDATLDDVIAAVEDEEPVDAATETVMALQGYRDAMTYVLQLAQDDDVIIDTTLIRALHFMMLKYDLSEAPGPLAGRLDLRAARAGQQDRLRGSRFWSRRRSHERPRRRPREV